MKLDKSIKTHKYSNGFRVVYQPSYNQAPVTYIYAFCDVGSVYEVDDIRGASHFIEHMCFKGTKKIPENKDLLLHYDRIGAYFNAYTEKRLTAYILRCDDQYVENSINIMSDMLLNSKFDKKEFVKEEMVVIEEKVQDSDDPAASLNDLINAMVFRGSSFENYIDTVDYHKKKYNYDSILDFYRTFYQPSRIVLSIVSNLSFPSILKFLQKTYFVKSSKTLKCACPCPLSADKYRIQYIVSPQEKLQIKLLPRRNVNTTHFCIGFRIMNVDKYALNVLKHILSSTFSSRLSVILREKEGLTYTSEAFVEHTKIYGGFFIYAETNKNTVLKNGSSKLGVLPIIIKMISDLVHNGITEEELVLAKGYIKGSLKMGLANNDRVVTHNGTHMIIYPEDELVSFSDIYEKHYKNITKHQIDTAIKRYFVLNGMSICMIGDDLPTEEKLRKICNEISL